MSPECVAFTKEQDLREALARTSAISIPLFSDSDASAVADLTLLESADTVGVDFRDADRDALVFAGASLHALLHGSVKKVVLVGDPLVIDRLLAQSDSDASAAREATKRSQLVVTDNIDDFLRVIRPNE